MPAEDMRKAIVLAVAEATRLADLYAATPMGTSALLCAEDAREALYRADLPAARRRAMHSLTYSVGIYHPIYKLAAEALGWSRET